jgi:hypothetical protein
MNLRGKLYARSYCSKYNLSRRLLEGQLQRVRQPIPFVLLIMKIFSSVTKVSIYGSTALCWALVAFQFFNPIHSRKDSLDGGSARRKAATYTQNNTNTE